MKRVAKFYELLSGKSGNSQGVSLSETTDHLEGYLAFILKIQSVVVDGGGGVVYLIWSRL